MLEAIKEFRDKSKPMILTAAAVVVVLQFFVPAMFDFVFGLILLGIMAYSLKGGKE